MQEWRFVWAQKYALETISPGLDAVPRRSWTMVYDAKVSSWFGQKFSWYMKTILNHNFPMNIQPISKWSRNWMLEAHGLWSFFFTFEIGFTVLLRNTRHFDLLVSEGKSHADVLWMNCGWSLFQTQIFFFWNQLHF